MDTVKLPRKLTAENGAKYLLRGEFFETREVSNPEYCGCGKCSYCYDTENIEEIGETIIEKIPIGWDTIKRIYDKIVDDLEIKI